MACPPLRRESEPYFCQIQIRHVIWTLIAVGIAAFLLQYAELYLREDQLDKLKRQSRMKAVLRKIAQKSQESRRRDDYHYIALSLYSDNLFGKPEEFIKDTIVDVRNNS
jgi:hypothetical protein